MDDSDDEFDQLAPPDNELDKVCTVAGCIVYWCYHATCRIVYTLIHVRTCMY